MRLHTKPTECPRRPETGRLTQLYGTLVVAVLHGQHFTDVTQDLSTLPLLLSRLFCAGCSSSAVHYAPALIMFGVDYFNLWLRFVCRRVINPKTGAPAGDLLYDSPISFCKPFSQREHKKIRNVHQCVET